MKYYSEQTKKYYNTEKECIEAETKFLEQAAQEKALAERKAAELKEKKEKEVAERKAAAEKVDVARKNMIIAQKAYRDEIENFCKKYGTYHLSWSGKDDIPSLFSLFDKFWF